MQISESQIEQAYALARERYAAIGVDTDRALDRPALLARR
jgi:L-rhamnose isomerase